VVALAERGVTDVLTLTQALQGPATRSLWARQLARYPHTMWRLALALALVAAIAWCCLLFGIGLDDIANERTEPGVVFSIVILPLCVIALSYGLSRTLRSKRSG
jgi:hypothetical protein